MRPVDLPDPKGDTGCAHPPASHVIGAAKGDGTGHA